MKSLLFCCACIIFYMHAGAQTDSLTAKDSIRITPIYRNAVNNNTFSPRMLISLKYTDSSGNLLSTPHYRSMCLPPYPNNRQTGWQLAGSILLSIIADKNNLRYNYTPKK